MKILITSDWYKPVINGVVTSVCNLKKGLEDAGHEVRILTLSNSLHSRKEDNVYYVGSIGAGVIYPNARILVKLGHNLLEELVEWRPDMIHSQCEFSTFLLARTIAKRTDAPIIHTYHTVYEGYTHYFCANRTFGRKMVESFTRRIADQTEAFIVPSAKIQNMLTGYGLDLPIHVIPSGIELDSYIQDLGDQRNAIRARFAIDSQECILVYVGRLAKEKNLEEVFHIMQDEGTEGIRLLLVGGGPYESELRQKVESMKLTDRVIFTGMVDPSEVAAYYQAGDIFVSASVSETQGLTYMEAMASGLPLLCRYDQCLDGVIWNGCNGYTFNDKEEFIHNLKEMLLSQDYRRELGAEARRSVIQRYSIRAFADKCVDVYQQSLGLKRNHECGRVA